MRRIIAAALISSALLGSSPALAGLSSSSVTNMTLNVHGIYLTSDPTCQTGLVATIPLSATAKPVNFAAAPTIGTGSIPSSIACVVIIFEDSLALSWTAGTYSTFSSGAPDSVCDAGGTLTPTQKICRGPGANLSYPTQVTTDAAAAGVTLNSSCPNAPVGTEIIPLYLSTYSACAGTASDPAGCSGGGNGFAAPTVSGDTSNGIKLTPPTAADGSGYTFVANPDQVAVGNNSGTCGSLGPPLFSFRGN